MNKLFLFAFISLTGLMAQAQSTVSETRKVADFTKIEVSKGIELIITQGDIPLVKVEADNNSILKSIVTDSNGNTLKVSLADSPGSNTTKQNQTLKVYVTHNDITGLRAKTGAAIKTEGEIKTRGIAISLTPGTSFKGYINSEGAVRLDAGSGSNFDGIVLSKSFHGDLKGGAVVKIAGSATDAVINSSTGATCLAANFKCKNAVVNARSTSSIVINVNDAINADTDDTASVTYYGNPASTKLGADSYAVKRKI
jgi:hypothetical protein